MAILSPSSQEWAIGDVKPSLGADVQTGAQQTRSRPCLWPRERRGQGGVAQPRPMSNKVHWKRFQTSLIEAVPIFERRIFKPQLGKSLCQGAKGYLRFEPGKRSTEAI